MKKVLILAVAISFSAWAKKSEDDHWKDIGLVFSNLDASLEKSTCYSSDADLFACSRALNSLVSFDALPMMFIPEAARAADAKYGPALEKFGPISLVTPVRVKVRTKGEAIRLTRERKAAIRKAWSELYKDKKADEIDFPEILKWFSKQKYFAEKESAMVAGALNGILSVKEDPHTRIVPKQYWKEIHSDEEEAAKLAAEHLKKGIKTVEAKLAGAKSEVALIQLNTFIHNGADGKPDVCKELKATLTDMKAAGATSIVLDIRNNPGGLLREADCIANAFLDLKTDEATVFTKSLDKTNSVERFPLGVPKKPTTSLPMVLLMNSRSASASELLAGALQDYQRAFLLGERTFGKGSVQEVKPFGDILSPILEIKTIARFYRPSGLTNQVEGVSPDIEVYSNPTPSADEKLAQREEDLYAALPAMGKKWVQPRPTKVKALEDCIQKNGMASTHYYEAIAPYDYQEGVALDAAQCIVDEKLWSSTDKRPSFPKNLVTTEMAVASNLLDNLQRELQIF